MRKLIIDEKTSEKRCAILEGNRFTEIHYDQQQRAEIVGNIYTGRVTKVLPGMQAAFVDIGHTKNGYLSLKDIVDYQLSEKEKSTHLSISHFVHEGQQIIVQVQNEGNEQKGPKLTTNVEFGGGMLVYMPHGNYCAVSKKIDESKERERLLHLAKKLRVGHEGLLFRTASSGVSEEQLTRAYDSLKEQYLSLTTAKVKAPSCLFVAREFIPRILHELSLNSSDSIVCDTIDRVQDLRKIYPDTGIELYDKRESIFTYFGLEQEIDKVLKRMVWLKNGAYIIIERTEAMVIIDVNTGKFSGKSSLRDTVLKTNVEAAREAVAQIRLRNLSGMILIDFIDMRFKEDQQQILDTISRELRNDRVQTKVIGFSELNILQLTRKKVRQPVEANLTATCPTCKGSGRVPSPESIAFKLERELWGYQYMDDEAIWVEASEDVVELFKGDNVEHLKQLERTLKFKILLTIEDSHFPYYHLKHKGDYETISKRISEHQK
ncbi:Rne/Rng family ribonuclease [Metabacillus herbersteinensis]|uniref:Rne/Rng family ribonuclease n=1 Tax=Metabacillus herbersteinensis TaxID=283816 RepID=A0ABV6G8Z5_9BACI